MRNVLMLHDCYHTLYNSHLSTHLRFFFLNILFLDFESKEQNQVLKPTLKRAECTRSRQILYLRRTTLYGYVVPSVLLPKPFLNRNLLFIENIHM
jgi:hypothetical protein